MSKLKVAVITGGNSSELEISLKSAQVVFDNLDAQKYELYLIKINSEKWEVVSKNAKGDLVDLNTFSLKNRKVSLDFAFIVIHGTPAEDGKLQGYFDLKNIPYSTTDVLSSAITFDKNTTKNLVKDIVSVAKSILLTNTEVSIKDIQSNFNLPIIVKPNKNGSSYGVSKVKDWNELDKAIKSAFSYDEEILIEEFLSGNEYACGIFQHGNTYDIFPITEIHSENDFFDYEAKYKGKSKEITPADLSDFLKIQCKTLSLNIFKRLKLKGLARIDYILSDGVFYLIEVNSIPGLSKESIIPQQVAHFGYTLKDFFDKMIQSKM